MTQRQAVRLVALALWVWVFGAFAAYLLQFRGFLGPLLSVLHLA